MNIDPAKMVFDAESYGNTVSSSIPIVLSKLKDQDNTIVIAGFGVGLSWGSTVLYKFIENGE
jgi:3-oxoacyl-[acyl-carrier-protein] synthase-3